MITFSSTGIELVFFQSSKHEEGIRAKLLISTFKVLPLAFSPTNFNNANKNNGSCLFSSNNTGLNCPFVQFFNTHVQFSSCLELYHSIEACKTTITLMSNKMFIMFGYTLHCDCSLWPTVASLISTRGSSHLSVVFVSCFILKCKALWGWELLLVFCGTLQIRMLQWKLINSTWLVIIIHRCWVYHLEPNSFSQDKRTKGRILWRMQIQNHLTHLKWKLG